VRKVHRRLPERSQRECRVHSPLPRLHRCVRLRRASRLAQQSPHPRCTTSLRRGMRGMRERVRSSKRPRLPCLRRCLPSVRRRVSASSSSLVAPPAKDGLSDTGAMDPNGEQRGRGRGQHGRGRQPPSLGGQRSHPRSRIISTASLRRSPSSTSARIRARAERTLLRPSASSNRAISSSS
jgi:hypothetical protein